ncbi:MAG: apolipoprotein N-acyltransferase [Cytophagales bacterium]|nr:apolipoprotein N-acyltransferase [Cytophagales bacterium]
MWLGWPTMPLPITLFIGFVPLLEIEFQTTKQGKSAWIYFLYIWLAMLVWNSTTTWWIWYATPGGMFTAIIANSLLMTIPFILYRLVRKTVHQKLANISLIAFWLGFEFIHLNWDLTWSWLTLGNGLANVPSIIQWYEYTGALGGSLWILVLNLLLFHAFKKRYFSKEFLHIGYILLVSFFLILPIISSFLIGQDYLKNAEEVEIAVIQPNFDPYTEKFRKSPNFVPYAEQVKRTIAQSEKVITPNTKYVVWPETAIQGRHREPQLWSDYEVRLVKEFVQKYPHVTVVTGIESWAILDYKEGEAPSFTRHHPSIGYYASYNTAIQVDAENSKQTYHKSKFVPGAEKIPFPKVLGFMLDIINFTQAGNYGSQEERSVFLKDSIKVAPLVCYESVFGEYVGEFVQNGANILFVITNDGWWEDTEGHRQHNLYARLRAIETRRMVARSANTGVSSFIAEDGSFVQQTKWRETTAIIQKVRLHKHKTFYVKHGDYVGRVFGFFSLLILVSVFVRRKTA